MSLIQKHTVILIPGLGDNAPISTTILNHATAHWSDSGLEVLIHSPQWRDGEALEAKLLKLLAVIDEVAKSGKVSIVGTSAGASLAFNAFSTHADKVYKAVNVCGRLREGNHRERSLQKMAQTSPAFYESVKLFEKNEPELTSLQKSRLMTIRPFFGDELVPRDTANLDGAHNEWIYAPSHMLGIYLSLRLSSLITTFLTEENINERV